LVERAFPGTSKGNKIDRQRLAAALAADPEGFKRLEAIVHPLVRAAERTFLAREVERGATLAVLEIPLLFETGAEKGVDVVVVASAPAAVQRERVLARPGMTAERLESLLAQQLSDAEKRRRADFAVDTGGTIAESERQVDAIVGQLLGRKGLAYTRHWISGESDHHGREKS
jgi:dephospho-CoA kinase